MTGVHHGTLTRDRAIEWAKTHRREWRADGTRRRFRMSITDMRFHYDRWVKAQSGDGDYCCTATGYARGDINGLSRVWAPPGYYEERL